jgi:hypothetical protein
MEEVTQQFSMFGFKLGVHEIGQCATDKYWSEKLKAHKPEIDEFLSQHPEFRRKV